MAKRYPRAPIHRVTVTSERIASAVIGDSTKCMIAESLKECVPEATNVAVDVATIRYTDAARGLRYVYLTPFAAQRALLAFDEGELVEPFTFLARNGHVTVAGQSRTKKIRTAAAVQAGQRDAAAVAQEPPQLAKTPGNSVPRRVGGRRPPQLRMMRKFGVRAFRGASEARLRALKEQKATSPEVDGE